MEEILEYNNHKKIIVLLQVILLYLIFGLLNNLHFIHFTVVMFYIHRNVAMFNYVNCYCCLYMTMLFETA